MGDKMKTEKDVLDSILKTTQMGQVGIRAVTPKASNIMLQKALHDQLTEYNTIECEAQKIARQRGWELKDLAPIAKSMSEMYTRFNLSYGNADSKIAAMMIQGNTRGIIKGLKNKHHCKNCDEEILNIAQKLLHCEDQNIKQMQGYL